MNRPLFTSYCAWVWRQWSRLSAFFLTTCIVVALTVALAQTTRQYNVLSARLRASIPGSEHAAPAALDAPAAADESRARDRVVRLLEEIRDRLPEPPPSFGPLSSSH
jgi:hypothetical protein